MPVFRLNDLGMEEDDDSFLEGSESLVTEDETSEEEDGMLHDQFRGLPTSGGDYMTPNEESSNLASESDVTLPQTDPNAKRLVPRLLMDELGNDAGEQEEEHTKTGLKHFAIEEDVISVISLGEYSKPTVTIDTLPDDLFLTCQVLTKLPNGEYKLEYRPTALPSSNLSNSSYTSSNSSQPQLSFTNHPQSYGFHPQ